MTLKAGQARRLLYPRYGHVAPESYAGGPIGIIRDGDIITIDGNKKLLHLHMEDAEIQKRQSEWTRPPLKATRGVLAKYAQIVRSASEGAVTF